jgi:hypothetical protein
MPGGKESKMTARGWAGAALAALALTLALAACGGEGADPQVASLGGATTSAEQEGENDNGDDADEGNPEEALLAYARCMREHGVDVPDPQVDEDGRTEFRLVRPRGNEEKFQEAQEACGEHLENARPRNLDPEQEQEIREAMLAFAKCMREHGVDMPDPEFGEGGRGTVRMRGNINPEDPKFREAEEACRDLRPQFGGRS